MKKFAAVTLAALALAGTVNASSFFGSSDKYSDPECWYNPDCNPYDPWDPRYWMEEMDSFWSNDNNYGYGGPYGGYGGPYGRPMGPYGAPMMPYGGGYGAPMMPYGGAPMPYGAPAPMGPQGPAAAPAPYAMPYGPRPMPAPQPQYAPRPAPAPQSK